MHDEFSVSFTFYRSPSMRVLAFACVVWLMVCAFPMRGQATDYIDLGLEKVDVYTGSIGSTDFVTIKPIVLLGTVRNYSNIAIDGFTLTPKIETYYEGTLLGPANGAFFFQPNYINNAPYTSLSIGVNGTFLFHADMTSPKAGHYRCVISMTVGGSIAGRDSNNANNQTVVEFDVRHEVQPKPDLAIENVRITPSGDTFQVGYDVRNIGTDPAQSGFDMTAKLYVILGPTTIATRTDVFRQHGSPLSPGASVSMGPFVIRDSRTPNAGLGNGSYTIGIMTVQGCNYESNVINNSVQTSYNFTGGSSSGPSVVDLGIEKTDVYNSGNMGSSDLASDKSLVLLVTVKNYSNTAIDGFTLTPKVETYLEGTLLGPANGAFYFQSNFINSAPYTNHSVDLNGTYQFSATISEPKAGHYLCNISFTLGGSIAGMDSNSVNNRKTIEFDVRQVDPPKPDLAIDNVRITKTADTFQIAYAVHNIGTDPAQSGFDMEAKIYVGKNPTTITTREDIFKPRNQPIAPGASVFMGPFVIRDSRAPSAGLSDGLYNISIFTTQGCLNDADVFNNRVDTTYNFWVGGGDYTIAGVNESYLSGSAVTVSFKCAMAQPGLKMGFFSVNESGINPKLGSKAVSGTSGTLQFTAPDQGRYLFKIYDPSGHILASSLIFTVTRSASLGMTTTSSGTLVTAPLNTTKPLTLKPEKLPVIPKPVSPNRLPKTAAMIKKRSAAMDTYDEKDRAMLDKCLKNLMFSGLDGYSVDTCSNGHDEAMIFLDENPDSERNLRFEGQVTQVRYAWPEEAGDPPGDKQIRNMYKNEAKTLGAKVLVDRPGYTAFELKEFGDARYVGIGIRNNGQTIDYMSVESETEE